MFKKLRSHLYVLQLLEYDTDKFLSWVMANPTFYPEEKKGRIGWSGKAKLLFCSSAILQLALPVILFVIFNLKNHNLYSFTVAAAVLIISLLITSYVPLIPLVVSAFLFTVPELMYRAYIFYKAKEKLKKYKTLTIIGVTGSYGKTTVKHLLSQILSSKYKTVATPESYNKMLSIAATILNQVDDATEILIVEMGAYRKGEISQICKMVRPKIGVITGITSQHLERFGSLKNIMEAKYELIESLPKDGYAIFNVDNPETKTLYDKCPINKGSYSANTTHIEISSENTFFDLFDQKVRTTLLGKHNVLNILATVAVAKFLGMENQEIVKRIPLLAPAPHRLEVIRGEHQSLIVDDAFSSNIEGYKAAFSLIREYKNYPKILVTPGLVELGKNQEQENYKMALDAADTFDFAVVVNRINRTPLVEGLVTRGWIHYNPEKENGSRWATAFRGVSKDKIIFVADDLNIATKDIFPKITRTASLILLENDLPDIYR
jgi:UDP-N-acetylmuramoyl-tripeptide--D-alanyl-D-alanine ligase